MSFVINRVAGTYLSTNFVTPLFRRDKLSPRYQLPITLMSDLPQTGRARLKIHLYRSTLAEHERALLHLERLHPEIYNHAAANLYRNLLYGYRSAWSVASLQLNDAELRLNFQSHEGHRPTTLRLFLPADLPRLDLAVDLTPWPYLPWQTVHFYVALLHDLYPADSSPENSSSNLDQPEPQPYEPQLPPYGLLAELQSPVSHVSFTDATGAGRHLHQSKQIHFTSFMLNPAGNICVEQWCGAE